MNIFVQVMLWLTAVMIVECGHTFVGTNVMRPLVYHKEVRYGSKIFQKRVEYFNYSLPYFLYNSRIQGILAHDLTYSGASANITEGGIGFNHVALRMKSDRDKELQYDIYIYA